MRLSLLLAVLALLSFGCATYDGTGYRDTAQAQQVDLVEGAFDASNCDAHRVGATALRDSETGTSKAFKGPFGVGLALESSAENHERQGIICDELLSRGVDDPAAKDNWRRIWQAHDATFGEDGQ